MSRRSLFLGTLLVAALAFVPCLFVEFSPRANPVPVTGPQWGATPPLAPPGAPIQLTFWNTTPNTVYVHDTSPWWVTDTGGTTVSGGGVSLQVVVPIPPGASLTWVWGQQDDWGHQVNTGLYVAHIRWGETADDPNLHEEAASIQILADVFWHVDPREVTRGDGVTLQLRNLSDSPVILPNSAPWRVLDRSGTEVFAPPSSPGEVSLVVGDSLQWTLDTFDLPPGTASYQVEIAIWSTPGRIWRKPQDALHVSASGEVRWTVTPLVQATHAVVAVTLTNATQDSIWIPHWPAYWIEDPAGAHVYDPWAVQAVFPVAPAASVAWAWNETQNDGSSAPPGEYVAKVRYGTQADPNLNQASFDFRLVGPPDCMFVQSTDPDIWYPAQEDTVHFRFTNCAPDTVGMINSGTWWIGNVVGFPVYWPEIALMYLPRYAPGQGFAFQWPREDRLGNAAPPPGPYYAFVSFCDKWYRTHYVVASNPVFLGAGTDITEATPGVVRAPSLVRFTAEPNPFNPDLSLRVELGARCAVRLEVFDVRGDRLRTLLAGSELPSGPNRVTWDGRDDARRPAPGGTYLFRLTTPSETRTLKAVLVK